MRLFTAALLLGALSSCARAADVGAVVRAPAPAAAPLAGATIGPIQGAAPMGASFNVTPLPGASAASLSGGGALLSAAALALVPSGVHSGVYEPAALPQGSFSAAVVAPASPSAHARASLPLGGDWQTGWSRYDWTSDSFWDGGAARTRNPEAAPAPPTNSLVGPATLTRTQKAGRVGLRLGAITVATAALAVLDFGVVHNYLHALNRSHGISWEAYNVLFLGKPFLSWWLYFIPGSVALLALIGWLLARWRGMIAAVLPFAMGFEDLLYFAILKQGPPAELAWLDRNRMISWTRGLTGTEHVSAGGLWLAVLASLLIAAWLLWPRKIAWVKRAI